MRRTGLPVPDDSDQWHPPAAVPEPREPREPLGFIQTTLAVTTGVVLAQLIIAVIVMAIEIF